MADVFGRETEFGGAISADATRMAFGGGTKGLATTGLLLQNVQISYSQNITRLFALEDGKAYFVAGRTQGQLGIQHVIGPAGLQAQFFEAYGDVCNIDGNFTLSVMAGCGEVQGKGSIVLNMPVINSINIAVNANNMIIGNGMQAMFVSMELTGV